MLLESEAKETGIERNDGLVFKEGYVNVQGCRKWLIKLSELIEDKNTDEVAKLLFLISMVVDSDNYQSEKDFCLVI